MRRPTPITGTLRSRLLLLVLSAALLVSVPGTALATDPSAAPTPTPTAQPDPSPTSTPTPAPTPTTSPIPTPTPTPTATPTPTPTPTPGVTVLGATVQFHGRGWGHGVGMSQHGARGRATDGQAAEAILAHYYRGATLGEVPAGTPIRVRVLKDFKASTTRPLVLYARKGTWAIDGVAGTFPKDARVSVVPRTTTVNGVTKTTWRMTVTDALGVVLRTASTSHFRMRGTTASTLFQVWSRPSSYDTYRGVVRAILNKVTAKANVVNEIPLEWYLRGVVPAEMPSTWPGEALKAQSIAARSYAARRLRPGVSWYDVADDTTSQVYLGQKGEKAATTAAIAATAGMVLKSGDTIANTLFHSAGGGGTEHNENVYVSSTGAKVAGPLSYLRGSMDRREDGTAFDATSPYATWKTLAYPTSQLSAWFASDARTNVGTLTALDLRSRGVSGRLIKVTLIGSLGKKTVSADVFRAVFNAKRPAGDPMLRSTLFDTKVVP